MDQKDDLYAGRVPRTGNDGPTVHDLCNAFKEAKAIQKEAGELSRQTCSEYQRACREIVAFFGQHRLLSDIQPRDFTSLRRRLAKGRGPVAIRNLVSRVKTVFNFGYQDGLLEQAPQYPSHEEETLDS